MMLVEPQTISYIHHSQTMMFEPLKFTRCTEFSATTLELHTIGFTQVCRILKPWWLSMNYAPQALSDSQNSQPQCLKYTPLNFTQHMEILKPWLFRQNCIPWIFLDVPNSQHVMNYVLLKFAGWTEFLSHGVYLEPRTTNLSKYTEPWCLNYAPQTLSDVQNSQAMMFPLELCTPKICQMSSVTMLN